MPYVKATHAKEISPAFEAAIAEVGDVDIDKMVADGQAVALKWQLDRPGG